MNVFNVSVPTNEECELKFVAGANLTAASVRWRLYRLETDEELIVKTIGDGIDILDANNGILGVTFDTTGFAGGYGHELIDGETVISSGVLTIE
jgi:hypothetical protein